MDEWHNYFGTIKWGQCSHARSNAAYINQSVQMAQSAANAANGWMASAANWMQQVGVNVGANSNSPMGAGVGNASGVNLNDAGNGLGGFIANMLTNPLGTFISSTLPAAKDKQDARQKTVPPR